MQSLDNNTQVFFSLVRAGLWEQDVQLLPYGDVKWQEVYRLATEQSVLGLVLAGLEHSDLKPPKEFLLQWIGEVQQIEHRNKAMNKFVSELIDRLRKEDVYCLLIKGQGVAQCYERPLWRSSGDVDLFLSEDNYKKAKLFLSPLAQSIEDEYAYTKHQAMTISSWEVEIHGNLRSGLLRRIDKQLDDIQRDVFYRGNVRSWIYGATTIFLPDVNNDSLYLFTHILQHYFKWGIGLRQVCDWCRVLWTFRDNLDLRVLESRLNRMGLMTEWRAFSAFAVHYLGVPAVSMPFYSDNNKWRRKADRIREFIIYSGNMGHNRDMSYLRKYPFVIRKLISLWRHSKDVVKHFLVFPLDSISMWMHMITNGLRIAIIGDK